MPIKLKRAYETAEPEDGFRILVDRLWPRGISKNAAHVDLWLKEIAPSTSLRKWFAHDPAKWAAFRQRYVHELQQNPEVLGQLVEHLSAGPITLVYSAKDELHNDAVVLKEFLGGLCNDC